MKPRSTAKSSKSTTAGTEARALLLWCREKRIAITRLKVGEIEMEIAADLALAPSAPSLLSPRPDHDPYEQFGGAALTRLREEERKAEEGESTLVEEDD